MSDTVSAALFDVSRTVNFEGNTSESSLRFQKTTVGLVLPSTASDVRWYQKTLSVFECLEPDEAKFLKKSTATLQQLLRARFFSFVLSL